MAAYNGVALIGETLDSLARQTLTDFEVIVVDDGSTDDTLGLLRGWPDPRVRVIASERNGGPVVARNRAVAEARGRYLAALDQDDLCLPERFARQVAYLDAHPDTVLVGTATQALREGVAGPHAYAPVTTPALIEWLTFIENPLVWSSVMIRADAARRLDPFTRPELLYAEDFDLYHRLAPLGRLARLDEELVQYRIHGGSISRRFVTTMRASATRVLAEAYADWLGDEAESAAGLVVRHLMAREPVADREAAERLGAILLRLQRAFLASRPIDRDSRRLIKWETARRWAEVGRAGLRSGALKLADTVSTRPDHLGLGYAGTEQLLWSRLVGAGRRYLRRA